MADIDIIDRLAAVIENRKRASPEDSYTAKLLSGGAQVCARKFAEEAIELTLASQLDDDDHIAAETADVIYHLLVLLAVKQVPLETALAKLEERFATSGLAEKAARNRTD